MPWPPPPKNCSGCQSTCTTCQGCNLAQTLCKTDQSATWQAGSSFSWAEEPVKDKTISKVWTAAKWNELQGKITTAYNKGSACSSSGQLWGTNAMTTVSEGDVITAEVYNKAVTALNKMGGTISNVNVGDVIKATHASSLATAFNSGTISSVACDKCNVGCDTTCLSCQGCNRCEGCQGRCMTGVRP